MRKDGGMGGALHQSTESLQVICPECSNAGPSLSHSPVADPSLSHSPVARPAEFVPQSAAGPICPTVRCLWDKQSLGAGGLQTCKVRVGYIGPFVQYEQNSVTVSPPPLFSKHSLRENTTSYVHYLSHASCRSAPAFKTFPTRPTHVVPAPRDRRQLARTRSHSPPPVRSRGCARCSARAPPACTKDRSAACPR